MTMPTNNWYVPVRKYNEISEYKNIEMVKMGPIKMTTMTVKGIATRIEGLGNYGTGGESPNYSIVEISQNTEKSLGDLRRHVITQIPVNNHRLTLICKTLKE